MKMADLVSSAIEVWAILCEAMSMLGDMCTSCIIGIYRFFIGQSRKAVAGEVVLITGSAHGLGRQMALEFGKLGATVVLWDINEVANVNTANLILADGGKAHAYTCDVSSNDVVYSTADRVRTDVGDVDILINNAGVVSGKSLLTCEDSDIENTFNVNLMAHFWTVKSFLPAMIRRDHGHIVSIASSTGLIGVSGLVDYSASKAGVIGFAEVLNYELLFGGHAGVHTTLVCPSFVKSGMFEGCRMRFQWGIPDMAVSETVNFIMKAILTNQLTICIPRLVYGFVFLKTLLPVKALVILLKFFGVNHFMDSFRGHKKYI